jgi:alkylhydroperoxidase family enzyme
MERRARQAWINVTPPDEARGELAAAYGRVSDRGDVSNILQVQSMDPQSLVHHHALYRRLMFGPSPLSRTQRESIAVVVSAINACHY